MAFERQLYASGQRGVMAEPSGRPREHGSNLSLPALIQSLGVDVQRILHNAGNAAFMALLGLQLLLDPDTKIPPFKAANGMAAAMMRSANRSPATPPSIAFMPPTAVFPPMGAMGAMGNMGGMSMGMMPFPVAGGLSPEVFQDASGSSRSSFFPQQRSISDHRLQVSPNVAMATGGRLPGRARVNSMNSVKNSVNEMGEQLGNMQLKSRSTNSRTPPNL